MKRNLTCIVCPMGCQLEVELEDGKVTRVTGNTCKRGEAYGIAECTAPTRTLTTTVRVSGGTQPLVSVKTAAPIPKELLFDGMKVLRKLTVAAPVALGQVVMEDLCGTGIGVVAGKEVSAR